MAEVSVCMASHNGSRFIRQQVESILSQLGKDDELIISDDGSTDGTVAVLEGFGDPRIRLLRFTQPNPDAEPVKKVTANFENALRHATGEYILLSDQDDVWHPHKVSEMKTRLGRFDYVQSGCRVIDEAGRVHGTKIFPPLSRFGRMRTLFGYAPFMGCCSGVTRRLLEKALPFPSGLQSHDRWLGYIGSFFYTVCFTAQPLIDYRHHGKNVSTSFFKSKNTLLYRVKTRLAYALYLLGRAVGVN